MLSNIATWEWTNSPSSMFPVAVQIWKTLQMLGAHRFCSMPALQVKPQPWPLRSQSRVRSKCGHFILLVSRLQIPQSPIDR
jgi:hypothetical protein